MSRAKTGGRKKGTPNKTTAEIRQAISDIVSMNIDTLNEDIQSLDPKDRIKFIIDLVNYVLPKIQSIEMKEPERQITKPNLSNVTYAEVKKVLDQLKTH